MSSEYTTLVQGLETYRHTGGTPQRNGVPHSLEP